MVRLARSVAQVRHLLGACAVLWLALGQQLAASLMNLPDGIENVLGFVPQSTFKCERDGYFGDIDNDCRLFHLCQRQVSSGGRVEWRHWTYACGNQTMFNQLTLTCAFVDEAIPCRHASQFQYLNEVIHKPAEPFLTDADVTSGFSYYSNRVMSDGARARAFHDSHLMAQIGVQHQQQHQQQMAPASTAFVESPSIGSFNSIDEESQTFRLPSLQLHSMVAPTSQNFQPARDSQPQWPQPQPQQQERFSARENFSPAHHQTLRSEPARSQHAPNLVEQHSFQLQHSLQNRAFSAAPTNFPTPQQQQQQQQQPPAPVESTPLADVTSSSSRQQSFATAPAFLAVNNNDNQQQQQRPSQGLPQQFEFAIATNHQAGAPAEPAGTFGQLQPLQQPQQQQQQQPQLPFQSAAQLRAQFAASGLQPPPAAPATTTTTTPLTSTSTTAAATAPSTSTEAARTTSAPVELISTSSPRPLIATSTASLPLVPTFTNSQRLAQVAQPTQATSAPAGTTTAFAIRPTTSTTTTMTTTTTTTATSVSGSQVATGQLTRASEPEQQVAQRRPSEQGQQVAPSSSTTSTARRASSAGTRARSAGFQSTRLSSAQKRQSDATPIVMRKRQASPAAPAAPAVSEAPLVAAAGPRRAAAAGSSGSSALFDSGDFWRRSFDAQLMAPKFESLLLRRRV